MAADDPLRDIDRRLAQLEREHYEVRSDVRSIREDLARVRLSEDDHITRVEFTPVRQITYGAVAVLLVAVLSAVAALVIRTS